MPRVGSSRMTTFGFVDSARAMTTFCWLPPERLPMRSSSETIFVRKSSTYFCAIAFCFRRFMLTLPISVVPSSAEVVLDEIDRILNRP